MTPAFHQCTRRHRAAALVVVGLVTLAACASSPPPRTPPLVTAAAVPDTTSVEEFEALPPNVATALMMGAAMLEAGEVRSALSYYRFAWDSAPDDPEVGRRFVDVALQAGRADEAIFALERLLEIEPDSIDLALQRAELLALTGRPEEALDATDELLARDPENRFGRQLRIDLLRDAGRTAEALVAVDSMIVEEPDLAGWRILRGDLALELDRPRQAEAAWREALELDPRSVEAVDRLSELMRAEDREDELLDLLAALQREGALGPAQQARLADLFLARGDREGAVSLLLPMAERGELEPRARLIVADLLASLDRRDEALALLEPVVGDPAHDDATILRSIGELRLDMGEPAAAVEALERAAQLDPADGDTHVSLLLALTQAEPRLLDGTAPAGRRENFERWIERTQDAVTPGSVRQNFLLGAVLRRVDRAEAAQGYLARAAEMDPENEQILYDLAVVQETNGDYEGARDTLGRMIALDPDDPHLKNFYGYLLADQGWELKKAERLIRDAVSAEPDNGAYLDSLGWVLYRQGRHEEALEHLIDAVNRLGDDPIVLEHLAECLAALGRHDEALRTFQRARGVAGDDGAHLDARIEAMREALTEAP